MEFREDDCTERQKLFDDNRPQPCAQKMIYVLPVSGGSFIAQLGLLCEVYAARRLNAGPYAPDIVLASSGGNVATYVALAADWSDLGIERLCRNELRASLFIESWFPPALRFLPNWLMLMKSSMYKRGRGTYELFCRLFTRKSISRVEVWTGTYDEGAKKSTFFCNRSSSSSFNVSRFNETAFLYAAMPCAFMKSDLKLISKVCLASASIPFICPSVAINGSLHSDGGLTYSSPLPAFSSEVVHIAASGLRLIYFCPYHCDAIDASNYSTKPAETFKQFIRTNLLQDRDTAVNIIHRVSQVVCYSSQHVVTSCKLAEIFRFLDTCRHFVLVLYPHGRPRVPLSSFRADQLLDQLAETRENYGAHMWYSPSLGK